MIRTRYIVVSVRPVLRSEEDLREQMASRAACAAIGTIANNCVRTDTNLASKISPKMDTVLILLQWRMYFVTCCS